MSSFNYIVLLNITHVFWSWKPWSSLVKPSWILQVWKQILTTHFNLVFKRGSKTTRRIVNRFFYLTPDPTDCTKTGTSKFGNLQRCIEHILKTKEDVKLNKIKTKTNPVMNTLYTNMNQFLTSKDIQKYLYKNTYHLCFRTDYFYKMYHHFIKIGYIFKDKCITSCLACYFTDGRGNIIFYKKFFI